MAKLTQSRAAQTVLVQEYVFSFGDTVVDTAGASKNFYAFGGDPQFDMFRMPVGAVVLGGDPLGRRALLLELRGEVVDAVGLRPQRVELRARRRGLVRLAQPMTQHIGLARGAERLQGGDTGRVAHLGQVQSGQVVEQLAGLGSVAGAAREGVAKLRERSRQCGEQARADAVARVALVLVARVFHPGLAT